MHTQRATRHLMLLTLCGGAALLLVDRTYALENPGSELQEVVVTAEKRSENIQDVPMSLSVVSSAMFEDLHATQLADIAGYVPGFQVNSAGSPGQASIAIRGIAPIGFAGGSSVATYIDDTPLVGVSAFE